VILTGTHPKGVKRSDYRSSSGAVGLTFKRKFEVKGEYGFVCTFHKSQMKFDLKVKK
jgi:plastocyanin